MFGRKKRKGGSAGAPEGSAESEPAVTERRAAGPPPGEPGSRIGRYTIESTLGQGSMGKVYLAQDPVIGRKVALKVITIRPDLSDAEAGQYRERFLREAQAAGALIHPNIVAVHDVGQDPATRSPYIVMEHVPGQDLKKVIVSRAPLSGPQAIGIVLQVAGALDYAHKSGIVHRDIKPANVLVTGQGRVKITDFGVARLPGSDLTRSDQFVGSPGFMSPEQLKGGQVDGRSDLFALGVILYQLLTGKAPFEGESVSEVLYRISTQPAEPPSETHADVSPDFDPILEKALAKDPAQRYQSGQDLIEALSPLARAEEPEAGTEEVTTGDAGDGAVAASPWFTLTSQWRLGVLVALLMLALIGVNWGLVALFHGPLSERVLLQEPSGRPSAAALVPGAGRGSAGTAGRVARNGAAPSEFQEPDHPVAAICAMSYAGPSEIARAARAARESRAAARGQNAGLAVPEQASGRIRLEVKHRIKSGRLVVLVDGRTVLSKPFEADKGKSGTVTHVLSVPAGRHGVEVRLLEDKAGLQAKSKITGTVTKNKTALLTGEQRSKGTKDLKLDWQVSH
jgi:protein kinase-like protein